MLTPEYLASCTEELLEMVEKVNSQVVRDISRRIVKTAALTESADFQAELLRESGMLQKDIISSVAKNTGKTESEVTRIFEESQRLNWNSENARASSAGFSHLDPSKEMKTLMAAHLLKTAGEVHNLTMTTASQGQLSFFKACTMANLQVSSGVFSPQEAIRQAIKSVARDGAWVQYPTGHRDRIDVAVRRAVLTGVNQSAAVINNAYADEIGTDLVEVTAHMGARPDHAAWQGQVYSRSGKTPGYPNFYDVTGYGTGTGLCGWNCRHNFHAYYEGTPRAYTDKQLKEMDSQTFEHEGKTYTEYQANQTMREKERDIRATKRELVGLDEGIKVTKDDQLKSVLKSDFATSAVKLKKQEGELREFAKATKRRVDNTRVQVHAATTGKNSKGFDKSVAQKAVDKVVVSDKLIVSRNEFLHMDYFKSLMKEQYSNVDARAWYIAHTKTIHTEVAGIEGIEERAKRAFELRNKYKYEAREMMKDQKVRQEYDISDPIVKDFEVLIKEKMGRKNMTRGEAVADILESSVRTRKSINKKLGLE